MAGAFLPRTRTLGHVHANQVSILTVIIALWWTVQPISMFTVTRNSLGPTADSIKVTRLEMYEKTIIVSSDAALALMKGATCYRT